MVCKEINFQNGHCFERLSWPRIDKSHVTYVMMLWQRVEDGNGGKTEGGKREAGREPEALASQPQIFFKNTVIDKQLIVLKM